MRPTTAQIGSYQRKPKDLMSPLATTDSRDFKSNFGSESKRRKESFDESSTKMLSEKALKYGG